MESIHETVEAIAKKFLISPDELMHESLKVCLVNRKKEYLAERFEILSRYSVKNATELEEKIKSGEIPEHPSWEDLIELSNLEMEMQSMQDDINRL